MVAKAPKAKGTIRKINRTNPLEPFMDAILKGIIGPIVLRVHEKNPDLTTRAALWQAFRDETGSTVSTETFAKWLDMLGIRITTRTQLEFIPNGHPGYSENPLDRPNDLGHNPDESRQRVFAPQFGGVIPEHGEE